MVEGFQRVFGTTFDFYALGLGRGRGSHPFVDIRRFWYASASYWELKVLYMKHSHSCLIRVCRG